MFWRKKESKPGFFETVQDRTAAEVAERQKRSIDWWQANKALIKKGIMEQANQGWSEYSHDIDLQEYQKISMTKVRKLIRSDDDFKKFRLEGSLRLDFKWD